MNSERSAAASSKRAAAGTRARGGRAWAVGVALLLALLGLFLALEASPPAANEGAATPGALAVERAAPPAELESPRLDAVAPQTAAPVAEVPELAESVARDEAPAREPTYDFEVNFQFLDSLDLPLGGAAVFAGPAGREVNHVGATDPEGRLRLRFQAFRENVALDFSLLGSASMRERLELRSGATTVVRRFASQAAVMAQRLSGARAGNLTVRLSGAQRVRGLALGLGDHKALESWTGWTTFTESAPPWLPSEAVDGAVDRPRMSISAGDPLTMSVGSMSAKTANSQPKLRGVVRDSRGAPLEGAVVTAIGCKDAAVFAFSDSLGAFAFDSVADGAVAVLAWKVGEGRARVALDAETPDAPLELALSRAHLRQGSLADSHGNILANWRLHIEERGPHRSLETTCVSDANGRFEFWCEATTPLRVSIAPNRSAALPALLCEGWTPSDGPLLRAPFDSRDGYGEARMRAVRNPSVDESAAAPATKAWLWRLDTGRGTELTADFPIPERVQFDARDLQPGLYEFELRRAGCAPVRSGPFRVVPLTTFDGGALAFAAPSRLRVEPRATRTGGANYGVLLARRGAFELATGRIRLEGGADLALEAGEFRFASEDLVETFDSFSLPRDAAFRLRPDGVAERLGP
jgi:hypothetical protein